MSRQLCNLHPNVDYKTAWGCPDCLVELRAELAHIDHVIEMTKFTEPEGSTLGRVVSVCDGLVKLRDTIQEGNARYSALFGELETARMKIALIQSYAVVLRANSDPSSIEHRIADELDNRLTPSSASHTAPSGT